MKPLILALALVLAAPLPAQAATHTPRDLRELAHQQHIKIGTAVDIAALRAEPDYRATLNREFTHVTAENAMKWESVEPQRGVYTWADADTLVDNARRHQQQVRGHNLLWHNQLPTWLTDGVANATISDTELRSILRDHITTEVKRYRGKIRAWDVVNEVMEEDGTLRQSIWLTHLGPGYIADAFRWAHRADPHAKLYVNDYNLEWNSPKIEATLTLIKDLQAQGVPVNGIGFQGHLGIQYDYPGDWAKVMSRFAALGLEVAITELDVRMELPVTPEKLATQAQYYSRALTDCLSVKACAEVTVWGFTDRHSWVPGWFDGQGAACLLDENLAPKPAYTALLAVK